MKATTAHDCRRLEQIPNIGPSLAADLRRIGIRAPSDLRGRDGFALYQALCSATGQRHAPSTARHRWSPLRVAQQRGRYG